jgi:hypothetical protein
MVVPRRLNWLSAPNAITSPNAMRPKPKKRSTQLEIDPSGKTQCRAIMPSRQNNIKVGGVIFLILLKLKEGMRCPSKDGHLIAIVRTLSFLRVALHAFSCAIHQTSAGLRSPNACSTDHDDDPCVPSVDPTASGERL